MTQDWQVPKISTQLIP